jgi:maleylpyruvate isomerase
MLLDACPVARRSRLRPVLQLYRAPFSTNVERVALALAHKGLSVESVVIDYADRSPVFAVSGQPLVPVLVDGGHVIADSAAILRYLEDKWPEPALFPREATARAEMDVFIEWFNEVWKVPPNAIEAELANPLPEPARVVELGARMRRWLDLFEALLDGRDHLLADEFSAADCIAFPFLKFATIRDPRDHEPFHLILEKHQPLDDRHPRLAAWIERVNARPRA